MESVKFPTDYVQKGGRKMDRYHYCKDGYWKYENDSFKTGDVEFVFVEITGQGYVPVAILKDGRKIKPELAAFSNFKDADENARFWAKAFMVVYYGIIEETEEEYWIAMFREANKAKCRTAFDRPSRAATDVGGKRN